MKGIFDPLNCDLLTKSRFHNLKILGISLLISTANFDGNGPDWLCYLADKFQTAPFIEKMKRE
jgi:hypothetical protein